MSFATSYVIVAGIAWIRRSRVETSDGRVEDTVWCVTFEDDGPRVRRAPATDQTLMRGSVDGFDWELSWQPLSAPFTSPHRVLRRLAPTAMETIPAIAVDGHVGGRALSGAAGHTARLWGKRHARTWGWAHASDGEGRWAHLLTATAPGLGRVSQFGDELHAPRLVLTRSGVEPPVVKVGRHVVEAPVESFVGLRYLDTDGSTVWCYHSEAATLRGLPAALEIAVREPLAGWREEP